MKKRILSMAIVVVMIVAMIPAMVLSTSGINYYDGYDAAMVADGAITVDASATPDTAYLAGEKISNQKSNTHTQKNNSTEGIAFDSYFAADEKGVYVWFSVTDPSLDKASFAKEEYGDPDPMTGIPTVNVVYPVASQGDRFELYVRVDSYETAALSIIDFDYLGQIVTTVRSGSVNKAAFDYACTTNESGWVGEVYMPWTALGFDADTTEDDFTTFAIAIQCNNAYNGATTVTLEDSTTKTYALNDHKAYCYDHKEAGSAYRGMYTGHSYSQSGDRYSGWQGSHFKRLNFAGIRTAVVADALAVDGVLDAAYLKSEDTTMKLTKPDAFSAKYYTAATVDGLYVYADIADSTLDKAESTAVNDQDKFQLYFQMGTYNANSNWGYIEMDYTAESNFRYVDKASAWYGNSPAGLIEYATNVTENGWTAEVFIPWCGSIERNGLNDLTKQAVSIAVQANDSGTGGAAYSHVYASNAWYSHDGNYGPSGNYWFTPIVFEFDTDVVPTVTGYAVYADAITLDGVKDAKYSELAVDYVDTVYIQDASAMGTTGGWHYGDVVLAKVYYAFTDTDVYVFVEVYDDTVSSTNQYEYVSIYSTNGESAGKFNLGANGTQGNASNYEGASRSYTLLDGTNAATANLALTYVGTKEAYTGYNVEFKMALSETDKAALAAGKAINVGIGVEVNNAKADGARIAYGYAEKAGSGWWVSETNKKGYMAMPEIRLDKDYEFTADITAANVSLGESIAVNYYAQLGTGEAKYYEMKFDFNGETTIVAPAKTENPGEYVFTFDGIAPQCMGDNIAATLLYNGVAVDAVAEYSVFQNCMNIINADPTNEVLRNLIGNLGAYGAAAQKYANYKTDALVNAGYEEFATTVESIDNSDRAVVGEAGEDFAVTAAGVYFDYVNKVYFKFTAAEELFDIDDFSVTINGAAATIEETNVEGEYIVYTDALYATEFDEVITFVITNGVDTQTVTYSVNAYCKAKLDAANANTAALAAATYAYGAAAEAYVA